MTDVAPSGIASKAITSHLVTAIHRTVSYQYIAPGLVTAAHCTVSYQHIALDRTTHSVEPTDISPIAYDTVSSPASATLKPLTPQMFEHLQSVLCLAMHSHRLQLPATHKLQ